MIQLRFVTCNDPVSASIRLGEYGFWASHVEAVMPDGTLLGAHYDGGVQARPKGYDAATVERERIVDLPCDDATEQKFLAFLRDQLGKPYDLRAIVALVAERDWRQPDSWFCSELQAAALEACGWMPKLADNVSKITPRDLLLIVSARIPLAA
ncbi:MAG: hypothetical protein ABR973_17315 [Candidatus Acidiferrales bacterium]|jgi:hypothetical protein